MIPKRKGDQSAVVAKRQHDQDYRPVIAQLRRLREAAGLTQRDLAERMKKPQPWVHKTETGERRADVVEWAAWCRACNVEPRSALGELLEGATPAATRRR